MQLKRVNGSYKEIFSKALKFEHPWGYPSSLGLSVEKWRELNASTFREQTSLLDKAFSSAKSSKWEIARIFYDILKTGSFCSFHAEFIDLQKAWEKANPTKGNKENPFFYIGSFSQCHNPAVLLAFAKEKYGICRTDLYNMFAVIETFGKADDTMCAEAACYTFYQLVEMLPLSYQDRLKVQPNWTIKEIREFKKSLNTVQTSGQDDEDEVQTSELPPENDRYIRFKKFTRIDLCERIIELENEIKILKANKSG